MSQEKVDRYKAQKANRKEIMKKEKRMKRIRNTVACLAIVGLAGWVGYSAWSSYVNNQPVESAEIDYTAMSNYLSEMYASEQKKIITLSREKIANMEQNLGYIPT